MNPTALVTDMTTNNGDKALVAYLVPGKTSLVGYMVLNIKWVEYLNGLLFLKTDNRARLG